MKVILYAAVSADGFIAKSNGDSDWVSEIDSENWESEIKKATCVVIGRKTFEQYYKDIYPVGGVINIILTSNNKFSSSEKNVFASTSPKNCLKIAENNGASSVLLTGGGKTNESFLSEGLIDEIIITIHPLTLGEGISVFNGYKKDLSLKLIKMDKLEGDLVRLRYKVIK